jgi:hypothetical protein
MPDVGIPAMDFSAPGATPDMVSRGLALGHGHSAIETNMITTPLSAWAAGELADFRRHLETKLGRERAHWVTDCNRNLFIFPNLIFITLWHTVRTFYPVSPDYLEVNAWALFPRAEPQDLRKKRIDNFLSFLGPAGFATPDDVAALEGCQRGFATRLEMQYSDISRGMSSAAPTITDELQMRAFWRQWYHQIQGRDGFAASGDQVSAA